MKASKGLKKRKRPALQEQRNKLKYTMRETVWLTENSALAAPGTANDTEQADYTTRELPSISSVPGQVDPRAQADETFANNNSHAVDDAEGPDQRPTATPDVDLDSLARLTRQAEAAELDRRALEERIHILQRRNRSSSGATATESATTRLQPLLYWLREMTLAMILGLGLLAMIDYSVAGDAIPLLQEPPAQLGAVSPTNAHSTNAAGTAATSTPSSLPASDQETPIVPTSAIVATQAAPATATPAPTAPPVTRVGQTAEPPAVEAVIKQVAKAEKELRSGQLQATMDYGQGPGSEVQIDFDLGGGQKPLRFHSIAIYMSTAGNHVVERIIIGEQSWLREANGHWSRQVVRESPLGELLTFLPRANTIAQATIAKGADGLVMRWYDVRRDTDMTLTVDPSSGVPRELRQEAHTTGLTLTVTYTSWNTPVEITPPAKP